MTDLDDFSRFADFIEDMGDVEFEQWYATEASEAQRGLADDIREQIEFEELAEEFE
jgi:hypothetical protein